MSLLTRIAPLIALLFAAASLRADLNLPLPAPPLADAATARVLRGHEVTIELRGHYGGSGSVRFAVVRQPAHGRLSSLRMLGDNRASISYTHDGGHADDSDAFAYVVQAGGHPSSPAEVRVLVNGAPARLQAPEEIDFGEIVAGASATRELPIKNAGGGVLEGDITVSSPWAIAPAAYRVTAGETETITITFRPNEAKNLVGTVTLTGESGESTTVSLRGTATAPLQAAPSPLPIEAPAVSQETATKIEQSVTPSRIDSPTPAAPSAASASASAVASVAPPPEAGPQPVMNSLIQVTARRLTSSRWELSWPAAMDSGVTYRTEERLLSLGGDGRLQTTWRSLSTARINASADPVTAELREIDPRQLHIMRVSALSRDGTALWESPPVALAAASATSHGRASWLLGLICVLAVFIILRWRANHAAA